MRVKYELRVVQLISIMMSILLKDTFNKLFRQQYLLPDIAIFL